MQGEKLGHEAEERKIQMMTTQSVGKLLAKLALPTIISMLITALYNLADTFFVRQLEQDSMVAALGVSLTLMTVIQAMGFFFGHGSGNYISRAYGRHDYDTAGTMASTGFFYALMCGAVLSVLGLSFRAPLAAALGAKTDATMKYTIEYITYILCAVPFMTGAIVMNNQLRLQGNAFFSMLGITSGAVLNVFLDPLFIFAKGDTLFSGAVTMPTGLGLGVAGAALATAISQTVSFVILAVGIYRSDNVKIHLKNFSFDGFFIKNIVGGGLPSLARQGIAGVATIFLNHAIGLYVSGGALVDSAQAAMTGVSKITLLLVSAVIGFGQGFQPICGFNYGAKRYDRVLKAVNISIFVGTVFLIISSSLIFIFADSVCAVIIGSSQETTEIATLALRLQMFTLPLLSTITIFNMLLQNIGETVRATLAAMLRSGLLFLPCVMLLPLLTAYLGYGTLFGIQISQAVADLFSTVVIIYIGRPVIKRLRQGASAEN